MMSSGCRHFPRREPGCPAGVRFSARTNGLPGERLSFFRTCAGAELALLVEHRRGRFAFEIKLSTAPAVSRGFWLAREDVTEEHTFVVAPVGTGYPMAEGVDVIPPERIRELFVASA